MWVIWVCLEHQRGAFQHRIACCPIHRTQTGRHFIKCGECCVSRQCAEVAHSVSPEASLMSKRLEVGHKLLTQQVHLGEAQRDFHVCQTRTPFGGIFLCSICR